MSASDKKLHIFITGATGFIGGCVLQLLLEHPKRDTFEITAYVRSEEKAKKLETFGVHTALGTFEEVDKLEDLASKADLVLNIADSDHYAGNTAIFRGIKKRHETTGEVPILIHTSGTGLLTDTAKGDRTTDVIYYDSDADQIESLPDTQFHRNVDLEVIALDKGGYARTYIILPGTVYGLATGKLVDAGIINHRSMQIPDLIRASLDRGQGGVIGEGKNVWPNVEIHDVAQLFIVVFDAALAHSEHPSPHGREGYFFAENGEHQLLDVYKAIAKALYELGKGKSPEPTRYTDEEVMKYFGSWYLGTNSRARAERSRSLGWKPTKTTADFLASIKPEVEALLAEPGSKIKPWKHDLFK
ncbi:NAD(P)-binding protein [Dentipellis sp. KUC8613]|nr:NAD(P)-binding protein [Dentipellis sp. KUC8613]